MAQSTQPGEATVRAFFAVELSPEAVDAADDVASELRGRAGGDGVKWVMPESFHVTLRFLGEVPRSRVSAVAERAADAIAAAPEDHAPFEMRLGALAAFPSLRRPRVVTLEVTPHSKLESLANSLERGLAGLAGIPVDERDSGPFRAHLTLGRVRRGGRAPSLEATRPTDPAPTWVDEIVLFRSEPARAGVTYTRLERIPFATPFKSRN